MNEWETLVNAFRTCYYGGEEPDIPSLFEEVVGGRRVTFYGKDNEAVISANFYPPCYLAVDILWSTGKKGIEVRKLVRNLKEWAGEHGVRHVYTLVHERNPQKARLERFYKKMGFQTEAVRLYAPLDGITDI